MTLNDADIKHLLRESVGQSVRRFGVDFFAEMAALLGVVYSEDITLNELAKVVITSPTVGAFFRCYCFASSALDIYGSYKGLCNTEEVYLMCEWAGLQPYQNRKQAAEKLFRCIVRVREGEVMQLRQIETMDLYKRLNKTYYGKEEIQEERGAIA